LSKLFGLILFSSGDGAISYFYIFFSFTVQLVWTLVFFFSLINLNKKFLLYFFDLNVKPSKTAAFCYSSIFFCLVFNSLVIGFVIFSFFNGNFGFFLRFYWRLLQIVLILPKLHQVAFGKSAGYRSLCTLLNKSISIPVWIVCFLGLLIFIGLLSLAFHLLFNEKVVKVLTNFQVQKDTYQELLKAQYFVEYKILEKEKLKSLSLSEAKSWWRIW